MVYSRRAPFQKQSACWSFFLRCSSNFLLHFLRWQLFIPCPVCPSFFLKASLVALVIDSRTRPGLLLWLFVVLLLMVAEGLLFPLTVCWQTSETLRRRFVSRTRLLLLPNYFRPPLACLVPLPNRCSGR